MSCAAPYKPDRVQLGFRDDTLGLTTSQDVVALIEGFDPRLTIAWAVYFQPRVSGGSVPTASNTWKLDYGLYDGSGEFRVLDSAVIAAGTALPDDWEYSGLGRVARVTASLKISVATEDGSWWLEVIAAPNVDLPSCIIQELYAQVKVRAPGQPLRLKA